MSSSRLVEQVIAGDCTSFTVTVKLHVALLPLASVAVLVTVVVPSAKLLPLAGTLAMFVTAQLSVAVTTKVTLLEHVPDALTTRLVEQVIVGGTVSVTLTVKVHVLLLPLLSRAVLVTVVVPTAKLLPLAGTLEMFVTAQLSVAVTTKVTLLAHVPCATLTTRLLEQVITGGCASFTVTVKLHVALLPLASVAVLVTVVVPTGKLLPLAGLLDIVTPGQLSVAVTTKVTLLAHVPCAALTTRLLEQVITGGCASFTVTVKLHVALLPCASVAVLVTVVVPTGKLLPLAGLLDIVTPVQLSVAVTTKVTLLAHVPCAALTTRLLEQVITARCASVTVVLPTGHLVPLAGLLDIVTPGQLSVAVTTKVTLLAHVPCVALTTRLLE